MNVISSSPKFEKVILPLITFASLIFIFFITLPTNEVVDYFLIIFGVVVSVFTFKNIGWSLSDEVIDCGDLLIFKKGKFEQKVKLKDIININYVHTYNNTFDKVTVYSRIDGDIGKELIFKPIARSNPFSDKSVIKELIYRVDHERNS